MIGCEITLKRVNPNALSAKLAGKLLAIILALVLVMGLLLSGIDRAFAAALPHAQVLVRDEQIRLGDVFDGLTKHADFVLAPAPKPGEELVWNEPTLLRIATAFNLPWRPTGKDEVRIRRAAVLVDADTLRAVVRDHLASLNAEDIYNVNFTSEVPEIIIPGEAAPNVELSDFSMQQTGGTFSAIVSIGAEGGPTKTVNLHGVAERMQRYPVLKADFKNGEIIGEKDITWLTQKAGTMNRGAVINISDIIGATPRRGVSAGEIIRPESLQMPLLIKRGDLVTMVFNEGGMYLTARGRALVDGAMGEVIKVNNASSNRQLEARVTGHKEVTVSQ